LRQWLVTEKGKAASNKGLSNILSILTRILGIKPTSGYTERQMPQWAIPLFNESDISAACKESEFITSDCVAKPIKAHILMADEYAQEGRLVKRLDDPALLNYKKLFEEWQEETDATKKRSKLIFENLKRSKVATSQTEIVEREIFYFQALISHIKNRPDIVNEANLQQVFNDIAIFV
jgi:hypothetical protein